jgi:hypothetical protein
MSLAIRSLAAQNVLLYLLAPGGINSINMRPLRGRFCYLVPGGIKCFIVPFGPWRHKFYKHATPPGSILLFGPWRHKMFHCTIWSLAAQNVSLYLLVPGGINVLLYLLVPGGTNSINMRPLWGRFS